VPIKSLHKMTVAQARKKMEAVGLRWQETKSSSREVRGGIRYQANL